MAGNTTFTAGTNHIDLKIEEPLYQQFPYLKASIEPASFDGVDNFTKHYYTKQLSIVKGDLQEGNNKGDTANSKAPMNVDADKSTFKAIQWRIETPALISYTQAKLNVLDIAREVRKELSGVLLAGVGYETPYLWANGQNTSKVITTASGRLSFTTGASITGAGLFNQTIKAITWEDIINVKVKLFNQVKGLRTGQINALINSDMAKQLMELDEWKSIVYRENYKGSDFNQQFTFAGINWFVTTGVDIKAQTIAINDSSVIKATKGTNQITLTDFTTAAAAGTLNCALFWTSSSVMFGYVGAKMYLERDNALYMGDIYNGLVMYGAEYSYHDYRGVVLLAQDII